MQLRGFGLHRDVSNFIDEYVDSPRRVAVRYNASFWEVDEVTVTMMGSPESYPNTLAGAMAALRA